MFWVSARRKPPVQCGDVLGADAAAPAHDLGPDPHPALGGSGERLRLGEVIVTPVPVQRVPTVGVGDDRTVPVALERDDRGTGGGHVAVHGTRGRDGARERGTQCVAKAPCVVAPPRGRSVHGFVPVVEIERLAVVGNLAGVAKPNRQPRRGCDLDDLGRELEVDRVLVRQHHLQRQQVASGTGQQVGLLGEACAQLGAGDAFTGRVGCKGRDRSRDPGRKGRRATLDRLAREPDRAFVDLPRSRVQSHVLQDVTRAREGVGNVHLRTRAHVVLVQVAHRSGVREQRRRAPHGSVQRDTAAHQLGAHRAIEHDEGAVGEKRAQVFHRSAQPRATGRKARSP